MYFIHFPSQLGTQNTQVTGRRKQLHRVVFQIVGSGLDCYNSNTSSTTYLVCTIGQVTYSFCLRFTFKIEKIIPILQGLVRILYNKKTVYSFFIRTV